MSALVDRNGLPLACTVAQANAHDSRLYEPTLEAFETPEVRDRPAIILLGCGLRCLGDSPVQPEPGNQEQHPSQPKIAETWFDPELYKKRNAVEWFFSWIEAFKKIVPRYERYEHSFLGLIHLACNVMIARVLG